MADDNTQELKIHIVSESDNTGFKSAAGAGVELTDATKQTGAATQVVSDELKKSGETAIETGLSHHELKKVLLDIGNVAAPGAGRALMELAMGPVGVGLALVGVYEMLHRQLEADEEAADQLAEILSKPMNAGVEGVQKAWDEAAVSLGKYYAKLKTAGQDSDPIATEIKRIKEKTDAQIDGTKKIIEALGKEEVAAIRVRDAKAGKTKEQTENDVAAAQARTAAQLDILDTAKTKADGQGSLVDEQKKRAAQNARLQREAAEATEAARQASLKFENDQASLKSAQQALDPETPAGKALKKRSEDAAKKMEDAQSIPDQTVTSSSFGAVVRDNSAMKQKAIADAQSEIDSAEKERQRYKKLADQLAASESVRETAFATAEEEKNTKQSASVKNQTRLRELPVEIKQSGEVEDIQAHSKKVVEVLNTHGGKLNESLGQLGAETGKTQQQMLTIVSQIIHGQRNIQQTIAQLEAQLHALPTTVK